VVLDKTGTLTVGNPEVTEVVCCPGVTVKAVVETAVTAERPSEHPLAKAVLHKAAEMGLSPSEPERFSYTPGKGIACAAGREAILVGNRAFLEGHRIELGELPPRSSPATEVLVARGGRLLGALRIADVLRPEAVEAVAALARLGLRTILLTGDAADIAAAVGKQLAVDEVEAELLPEEKVARVQALVGQGKKVAMVGDGINDAPALAQADLGVAIGTGADVAVEASDITLVGDDLRSVPAAIQLSRATMRVIRQNLAWAFGYNLVLIPVAAGILFPLTGWLLSPALAAGAMALSSVSVVTNSLRLTQFRPAERTLSMSPWPLSRPSVP